MSRRKSPSRLEQLCVQMVCTNLDRLQAQLANLPSIVISNVYQCLGKELFNSAGRVGSADANVFIHSGTKSIHHIALFYMPMYPFLIDKIGEVCRNLLHLDLNHCSYVTIPTAYMIELVQRLPKLEMFAFPHRKERIDPLLAAIGKNCLQLRDLNLICCFNITDVGLRSLSDCKKLEILNILINSTVTPEGCLYILNQLPLLRKFRHEHWHGLFDLLKEQFISERTFRTYPIDETLFLDIENIEDIIIITSIFPNLPKLRVDATVAVTSLDIVLVQAQGVAYLTLLHFKSVDLRLIHYYCPLLQILILHDCTILNIDNTHDLALNLRFLQISRADNDELGITESQMIMLITENKNLNGVCIEWCQTLTDQFISALKNLKSVSFDSCHSINQSMIIKILTQNPLQSLRIENCFLINLSVAKEISTYIRWNNLDLEWFFN